MKILSTDCALDGIQTFIHGFQLQFYASNVLKSEQLLPKKKENVPMKQIQNWWLITKSHTKDYQIKIYLLFHKITAIY